VLFRSTNIALTERSVLAAGFAEGFAVITRWRMSLEWCRHARYYANGWCRFGIIRPVRIAMPVFVLARQNASNRLQRWKVISGFCRNYVELTCALPVGHVRQPANLTRLFSAGGKKCSPSENYSPALGAAKPSSTIHSHITGPP
jgi:hypothetical protein